MDENTLFFATTGGTVLISVVMLWSMIWKGIALWRAGRNNQIAWFVILFLVNTVGILEIIYILTAGKKKETAG